MEGQLPIRHDQPRLEAISHPEHGQKKIPDIAKCFFLPAITSTKEIIQMLTNIQIRTASEKLARTKTARATLAALMMIATAHAGHGGRQAGANNNNQPHASAPHANNAAPHANNNAPHANGAAPAARTAAPPATRANVPH